jgi:hypothetical protein
MARKPPKRTPPPNYVIGGSAFGTGTHNVCIGYPAGMIGPDSRPVEPGPPEGECPWCGVTQEVRDVGKCRFCGGGMEHG